MNSRRATFVFGFFTIAFQTILVLSTETEYDANANAFFKFKRPTLKSSPNVEELTVSSIKIPLKTIDHSTFVQAKARLDNFNADSDNASSSIW